MNSAALRQLRRQVNATIAVTAGAWATTFRHALQIQ
jgi:hypothetical protein